MKKDNEGATPDVFSNSLMEYLTDAAQRSMLFMDVLRQRGNDYLAQMEKKVPNVLQFEFDPVMNGAALKKPVNYGIVKIRPPKGVVIDDRKRPFVVFDPRAGHGPGIGGFKADSEIGEALKAGHPSYFVGFSPDPMPGQTIEAVLDAWAEFLRLVANRHQQAEGKPVVVGNCQAGWALLMMAAKYPDVCGPMIVAGSPVSYWGGVHGVYPMRYTGGLLGGSWMTALLSDLGNGKFDGAYLVQNFESLNPANTLWSKQYNLYANIDTEGPRYLEFEKWWGGHVLLTGEEIQYIVDNLFVGNKLSTAGIVTSDGARLDLRKIPSPIVCLCSQGDNITPPQQALGWILDLYQKDEEIVAAGQTIIYAIHENIGHLGIFVSASVAKKEHLEFASNIDLIDCLPPGLYEAVFTKKTEDAANVDLVFGDYISTFEQRTLDDLRALGGNTVEDERCFATVARLSEINLGIYRTTLQPLVRALVTEEAAEWSRRMHPSRVSYEIFSDKNPFMQPVTAAAEEVRKNRAPVSSDNPYLQWEKNTSKLIESCLKNYGEWRDAFTEKMFFGVYNQQWVQALFGLRATDEPPRKHPGEDPDHKAYVKEQIEALKAGMDKGGLREAAIRALLYVRITAKGADERGLEMLRRIRMERGGSTTLAEFKQVLRDQYLMLLLDERAAVEAIPKLLKGQENTIPELLEFLPRAATAGGPLNKEGKEHLEEITAMLKALKPAVKKPAAEKPAAKKPAKKKAAG